ncbi:hypothetical protein [Subdoligranulum variabile]|uniref:HTH merR-type domain-containing protein n=1 Tax=Subdoligranulum variabile DSM 15176 TaxID=411471 RepID=D1PKJ2_9FIRM|nr:hypothetical protein [Subdoligranulum variabile]EFB76500.1 hypothetical protein SUBVAR_04868 [Subdoligranulum variabile DSM 15176]UWP68256.1 hypothetical protein NQ490_15245 [Subdoligranulum variabile]
MKEISEEHAFRIRRNLKDAGCGLPVVTQYLDLEQRQCRREQYRLLSCQKSMLLQKLHRIQYKIDCLDHLVYTMQQEDEEQRRRESCKKQRL